METAVHRHQSRMHSVYDLHGWAQQLPIHTTQLSSTTMCFSLATLFSTKSNQTSTSSTYQGSVLNNETSTSSSASSFQTQGTVSFKPCFHFEILHQATQETNHPPITDHLHVRRTIAVINARPADIHSAEVSDTTSAVSVRAPIAQHRLWHLLAAHEGDDLRFRGRQAHQGNMSIIETKATKVPDNQPSAEDHPQGQDKKDTRVNQFSSPSQGVGRKTQTQPSRQPLRDASSSSSKVQGGRIERTPTFSMQVEQHSLQQVDSKQSFSIEHQFLWGPSSLNFQTTSDCPRF